MEGSTVRATKSDKELKAIMEASGQGNRHNWLYSFMNRTYGKLDTSIYLVGYCKQCDQTVSVLVPVSQDGSPRVNRAGIPKDGCDWGVPPNEKTSPISEGG